VQAKAEGGPETPPAPLVSVLHHGGAPIAKVRTGWASCVRDAGLNAEISPHWLRHTAATWLMEGGAEMWQAAGYLGMTPDMLATTTPTTGLTIRTRPGRPSEGSDERHAGGP
jgi:integrase